MLTMFMLMGDLVVTSTDPNLNHLKLEKSGAYIGYTFEVIEEVGFEGEYVFRIKSEDHGLLYLSSNISNQKIPLFITQSEDEVGVAIATWPEIEETSQLSRVYIEISTKYSKLAESRQRDFVFDQISKHGEQELAPILFAQYILPTSDLADIKRARKMMSLEVQKGPYFDMILARQTILEQTAVGQMAPNFSVEYAGQKFDFGETKGKWVLLNFWASWCGPCREEHPQMVAAHQKFSGSNLEFLSISLDFPGAEQRMKTVMKKDGMAWPNYCDFKGFDTEAAQIYAVRSLPMNILISPEGKIVARGIPIGDLESELQKTQVP